MTERGVVGAEAKWRESSKVADVECTNGPPSDRAEVGAYVGAGSALSTWTARLCDGADGVGSYEVWSPLDWGSETKSTGEGRDESGAGGEKEMGGRSLESAT